MLEHGAHAGGAEALAHGAVANGTQARHGAHVGGAEALAHGAARCRKRGSNAVPSLAELKHLHNRTLPLEVLEHEAHAGGAEALAHGAARCR